MKPLLIALTLISSSAFAQVSLDFRAIGSSFQLDFNRGFVCQSNPAFSKAPTLGYGQTKDIAAYNATNNCIAETGNHRMHCDDVVCEPVNFNGSNPTVSISVINDQIGVRFSAGAKHSCAAESAFGKGIFIAEAPTRLEAKTYAERLCMEQTGNAQMHCEAESCQAIAGAIIGADGIDLSSIFGSSRAEKIAKIEREIRVIEQKLSNPHISEKSKQKLKKELSKKTERLIELKA